MTQNEIRAAKIKLSAALVHNKRMIEGPLSLRFNTEEDLAEIGEHLGMKLGNPQEGIAFSGDRSKLKLLQAGDVPRSNSLGELVTEFQAFLAKNSNDKAKQSTGARGAKTEDSGISYGIGLSKIRPTDPESALAIRIFSRTAISNFRIINTKWRDRFEDALGVRVAITRMKEPALLARGRQGPSRYRAKTRPVAIGSGISSAKRSTGSVTLVVMADPARLPALEMLHPDRRYLLSAGHIFWDSAVGSMVHQPSLQFDGAAETVARVVHIDAPDRYRQHVLADFSLSESTGGMFLNAWGADATPVKELSSRDDVDIGATVHKMGGAGTGDAVAEVTGVEIDVDMRWNGSSFRYLNQLELGAGAGELLSEPGDSGALVCHDGRALAMIVGGSERRGQDEPFKATSYATFLDHILATNSLKIVY